jgi:NADH:ubiquinone oxidoreductase subunit 4 (subunit M)
VPLVVLVIWVGVYPNTLLEFLHVPVQEILHRVTPSLQSAQAQGLTHLVDVAKGMF